MSVLNLSRHTTRIEHPSVDAPPFGAFPGQILMGERATLTYERLEDGDPRAVDILGHPIRRGMPAIHISCKDDFGSWLNEAGIVHEIAWSTTEFERPNASMGGTDPEAVCIAGNRWDDEKWNPTLHIARWSNASSYLTWDSLARAMVDRDFFHPRDVIERINDTPRQKSRSWQFDGPQHKRAVRVLLDLVWRDRPAGEYICQRTGGHRYAVRTRQELRRRNHERVQRHQQD